MDDTDKEQKMKEPIKVWRWDNAPAELRALSTHGGDEDWVALILPEMADSWIPWLEEGSAFGCCSVSIHVLPDGSEVKISTHTRKILAKGHE